MPRQSTTSNEPWVATSRFRTSSCTSSSAVQPQHLLDEAGLLEVGGPPFDTERRRSVTGELDGVHPFEAGEVEHPQFVQGTTSGVGDDLHDAAELRLVPDDPVTDRVTPAAEVDVVRRPRTVPVDDLPAPGVDVVGVHVASPVRSIEPQPTGAAQGLATRPRARAGTVRLDPCSIDHVQR